MDSLIVVYHVHSTAADIEAQAEAIAIEQSIEMPTAAVREPAILSHVLGQVDAIEEEAPDLFRVRIRFPAANVDCDPAQFINVLFGNTSYQPHVTLIDAELPPALLSAFPGPRFGVAGLRMLTGAGHRPLTCTALKPLGSSPTEFAELARIFARSGIDIIKDDHGLANQRYAPFAERVRACQVAVDEVYGETGHRAVYVPHLLGTPETLARQADIAQEAGVRAVMVAPMLVGLPTFYELVASHLDTPVLGHPALGGAWKIAPEFLFGKLFRLYGADAVIFLNYGGRFPYSQATCRTLAANLRAPWGHLRPALPTPAGGMTVDRVGEMLDFYGRDVMLLISGGLLTARERLLQRSAAFVREVALWAEKRD